MSPNRRRYLPILKGREGEYGALRALPAEMKEVITPLLELPPIPWDFEADAPSRTIDKHLKKVGEKVEKSWGTDYPVYVDLLWIPDDERMDTGQHPVEFVFESLRERRVLAVPVLGLVRSPEYVDACSHVVQQDGRGACLRLQREDLVEFSDLRGAVADLMQVVNISLSETDLLFDLRGLLSNDNSVSVASLVHQLPNLSEWRSFTLAGTSFPPNLIGLPPSDCSLVSRSEWQLWLQICNRRSISRLPFFGDYAISHPEPAEVDPRIMRPSASVRYTADGSWLVLKGRNLRDHGYTQFHDVCRDLIRRSEYSGPSFSWGDGYIRDCAAGRVGTGNLTTWRKVGTSHHLHYVVEALSSLP